MRQDSKQALPGFALLFAQSAERRRRRKLMKDEAFDQAGALKALPTRKY